LGGSKSEHIIWLCCIDGSTFPYIIKRVCFVHLHNQFSTIFLSIASQKMIMKEYWRACFLKQAILKWQILKLSKWIDVVAMPSLLKRKFFHWRLWKFLIHHTYINPQTNWILISIYHLQYPSSCGWILSKTFRVYQVNLFDSHWCSHLLHPL